MNEMAVHEGMGSYALNQLAGAPTSCPATSCLANVINQPR